MSEIHEAASMYLQNGFSVIPVNADKTPIGMWDKYKKETLPIEDIPKKFNGATHMAIVCGEVSSNLEDLDLDDATVKDAVLGMIKAKHPDIVGKFAVCQTPYGYAIVYRCEKRLPAGHKVAMTWTPVDEPGEYSLNDRPKKNPTITVDGQHISNLVRIETRAEGNYFLVPPSPGYDLIEGTLESLQPISKETRDSIIAIAKTFDLRPAKEIRVAKVKDTKKKIPWPNHIFSKAVKCEDILEENGWVKVKTTGKSIQYSRPGGVKGKASGEIFLDSNTFQPYTTSAHPLEPEHQYTSFDLLKHLTFDSDFTKASLAIADEYPVILTSEELKEILEDNPDELDNAYRRSGLTEAEVTQVAIDLGLETTKPVGRRTILYDKLELSRVVRECDEALFSVGGAHDYCWFSDRVGFINDRNTFTPYDKDSLEVRAEDSFNMNSWVKKGKKEALDDIRVPEHIFRKLLNYNKSGGPVIKGFSNHPVVLPNGEIIGMESGFESGIMFNSDKKFKVDSRNFKECYDRIVELFCGDILFKDKEKGQALFVAMMMTGLTRLGIDGGAPGFFITANEAGTGKSTLFEFVSRTVYDKLYESVDWGISAEERRKEIIAYLREGQEVMCFDNIPQGEEVKSPILAQALTAGEFTSRIMGQGNMTHVPAQSLFVFIGNNLNMSAELARRLMTIELLANTQNPATRKVHIKNIGRHCEIHRDEVIGCLLKMLQEGCTMEEKIEKSSGFNFWDQIVRNPLFVETGIDISQGFETSYEASGEVTDVAELINALVGVFGAGIANAFTTKEVFLAVADERVLTTEEIVQAGERRKGNEDNCLALRDVMKQSNALSTTILKSTGNVLSTLADRIVDDLRFVRHKTKSKTPVKHWIEVLGIEDENEEGEGEE